MYLCVSTKCLEWLQRIGEKDELKFIALCTRGKILKYIMRYGYTLEKRRERGEVLIFTRRDTKVEAI